MQWITEENYAQRMCEEVEPWLAARCEAGFDERVKGEPIYYEHYRADAPKAVIVISHGFTESIRKYAESIYYMLQAGFEVWGLDHRGHGRSFRPGEGDPCVVHADRFEDYVLDLVHLVETRVKRASGALPLYLYCHSMGGCIGARTIEEYPALFDKAVLSSPMLGVVTGKIPAPLARAVLRLKGAGAKGREPMAPAVFTETEADFPASAGNSECRFRCYLQKKLADRRLQTCAPSMNWILESIRASGLACSKRETAKIRIPVLLLQAGRDSYVRGDAQDRFAAQVPGCELLRFPALRHELYMSDTPDLIPYWEKIFAFLG